MDEDVKTLLNQAEYYVELAATNLMQTADVPRFDDGEADELDEFAEDLKIYFLFPRLSGRQKTLLAGVALFRRALVLGVNTKRSQLNREDAEGLEKETRDAEQLFMKAKNDFLESGIALSDTQQRILNQHYFKIEFPRK